MLVNLLLNAAEGGACDLHWTLVLNSGLLSACSLSSTSLVIHVQAHV